MSSAVALISFVVAAVAVVGLVRVSLANTRRRQQVDALMLRIGELEKRLTGDDDLAPARAQAVVTGVGTDDDAKSEAYSADVLAGWTSHVGRVLAQHSTPDELADRAVVALYRQIGEPIKPSDLAAELYVSLRTLERGLSRALDCSPGRLILAVKMREARRMLATGQLQVGDVAHRLAFFDAAHFAKRYRQFYRCPPSRHLAKVRKSNEAT